MEEKLTFFSDLCSQLVKLSLGVNASFLVVGVFEALLPLLDIALQHDDLERSLARWLRWRAQVVQKASLLGLFLLRKLNS